ncbi:MAG: hypothetical protein JWN40_145 [Phycisphaerales bacterium]|nr:hypothetical protein [Phycisphaerales bacterium]
MSFHALFVEAVRAQADLPALLRERASDVTDLEQHQFEESYLAFLDEQIRLSPRGPQWAERLARRRAALLPFRGLTLLRGLVQVGDSDFTVEIDLTTRAVVHWEEDEHDRPA